MRKHNRYLAARFRRLIAVAGCVPLCAISATAGQDATSTNPVRVTLVAKRSLSSAIVNIGLQSHIPIGIVVGSDNSHLCNTSQSLNIRGALAFDALQQVANYSDYKLSKDNGVILLLAPDIPEWQEEVLTYKFPTVPALNKRTMANMGIQLTGWIMMGIARVPTFAYSFQSSVTDQKLSLPTMHSLTVSEIADRIVSLDEGGMWIMKPTASKPQGPQDLEIQVISYHDKSEGTTGFTCGP